MNDSTFFVDIKEISRWKNYGQAIKDFFISTCRLPDVPGERNISIVYATPSTAFAKYIIPIINGESARPVITFSLTGEESVNETPAPYHTNEIRAGYRETVKFQPPILKQLTYRCDLFTTTQSESDTLLTQIELSSWEKRPYYTRVDGQGTDLFSSGFANETVLNPTVGSKKIIHHSFNIVIPRAYIFLTKTEEVGVIETINVVYK